MAHLSATPSPKRARHDSSVSESGSEGVSDLQDAVTAVAASECPMLGRNYCMAAMLIGDVQDRMLVYHSVILVARPDEETIQAAADCESCNDVMFRLADVEITGGPDCLEDIAAQLQSISYLDTMAEVNIYFPTDELVALRAAQARE